MRLFSHSLTVLISLHLSIGTPMIGQYIDGVELRSGDVALGDNFGHAVDIDGNTAIVRAKYSSDFPSPGRLSADTDSDTKGKSAPTNEQLKDTNSLLSKSSLIGSFIEELRKPIGESCER